MAISREYKVKIKATIDPSEISKQIDALGKNSKLKFDTGGIDAVGKSLTNTSNKMKGLGSIADSVFGKFNLWYGIAQISHQIYNAIGDVVTNTVKLDTALTGLSKVSDMSKAQLQSFAKTVGETGVEVGRTTTEMVDAAAVFAQAGWSDPKELELLAKSASMFSNIADTQTSTAESAEFLIATMKAYNMTAEDTEHIMDAVNEVSNKYAVSSGDLASSIGRVASTLQQSGTSFEETLGLMTGATEIIRNPGKVANGLKTISLRLQGMQEAADGSTESVAGLSSKMQESFSEIGVNIVDQNGNLRSTYDILVDIGRKWPELSAEQKTYYSELAAGKNQANIFAALMQNIGVAVEATNTALDSNGSAVEENAKRMDSVQGKIEQFQAAWEKLSTSFMSSDFLKNIIDTGTALVNFFDTDMGKATVGVLGFTAAAALLLPKIISIGSAVKDFMGISKLFKVFDGVDDVVKAFGQMGGAVTGTTKQMAGLIGAFQSLGGAAVLGPIAAVVAAIAAVGPMIAMTRDREREFHESLTDQTDAMVKQYETAQGKAKEAGDDVTNLRNKINELKEKGTSEGGLSVGDTKEIQAMQRELDGLIAKYEFLSKQAYLASEQVTKALKEELFATTAVGQGMGSLSGQQMNMVEETAGLTAALTRNRAEYDALTKAGKENSVEGKTLANTIKHQEEAFDNLTPRLQEIHDQLMKGGEAEQAMAKELEPLILNATRATEGTNNLAKAAANMKDNVKLAMLEIGGQKISTQELGENFLQLASSFAAGGIEIEDYAAQLQGTLDSINMDDLNEAYRVNATESQNLTNEQKALLETAKMLQSGMSDVYQRMTEDGFEYTDANIQMYSDSIDAMLQMYATEQGIWKDSEGNWQGANQEAINYISSIEQATAAMDGYGAMNDWVAGQQEFLATTSSDVWDSIINGSEEGAAQATANLESFTTGFIEQMNQLKGSNETAFNDMVATISESTGIAQSDLLDANGNIRSDLVLTADQAGKIGEALKNGVSTGMEGIRGKLSEIMASAPAEFSKLIPAATTAGNQSGDSIKQGILKGVDSGITEGQSKFGSAQFKNDKAEVKVGTVDTSTWDSYPLKTREVKVVVNEVAGTKVGKASGDDFIKESGFYTVGEAGRETVFLPRGSAVATASETRNMRGMLRSGRGSSGGIEVNDDLNDSFKKIANSLVKVTKTLTGVSISATNQQAPAPTASSGGASMARAASYDDPHKQNFDAAYDELKYLQDMDRISEQDYLNRLENLNNSYFGGRMEYLEEYRKYEVEVYKGRKKLQEQAQRDAEKAEKDRIQAVKDGFEKEADALEYMRDKDLITEEDYYRQLSALNDKYYKGKTEFLDEYQKYEIKVYEYLKKKEEERLKELKEQTEKQYENTKDYIVDMIDKQIDAEEGKLDQLDKEKEQQEKLQKIEEARKKLAEAQQQKVLVYRAGQGFVYESDAAAIEEANKELNELLEEEKFDKQKQEIQDEIDRLEELKDAWQDSLDINGDLEKYGVLMDWIKAFEEANYEDRLAMAEQFKESYKKALEEIAKAQENISNTASSQLPNFKPNGYARGTNYVRQDEKAVVGENGPELVNLPKGSGVLTAQETQNMRMWGALTPVSLFSDIYKLISSMPRYTFDTPSTAPSFDFSSWTLDVDVDSGLVDAIQNSLRETVIQYISKRDR